MDLIETEVTTEVRSRSGEDEELRSVGVRTLVGHRENTGLVMVQLEVLIRKISPTVVDRLAAGSLQSQYVSALDDEAGNHTVEVGELVTVAMISSAENPGHGPQI